MKRLLCMCLVVFASFVIVSPVVAKDAAWKANFESSIKTVGLQQAIAAELEAGTDADEILDAILGMEGIDPGAAIQAAIKAGIAENIVTAAADKAGISPALIARAISAAKRDIGLGFTPAEGQGPVIGRGGPSNASGGGGFISPAAP